MYKTNKKNLQLFVMLVSIAQSFPAYSSPFSGGSFNNIGTLSPHSAMNFSSSSSGHIAPISSVPGSIAPVISGGQSVVPAMGITPVGAATPVITPIIPVGPSVVPSPGMISPIGGTSVVPSPGTVTPVSNIPTPVTPVLSAGTSVVPSPGTVTPVSNIPTPVTPVLPAGTSVVPQNPGASSTLPMVHVQNSNVTVSIVQQPIVVTRQYNFPVFVINRNEHHEGGSNGALPSVSHAASMAANPVNSLTSFASQAADDVRSAHSKPLKLAENAANEFRSVALIDICTVQTPLTLFSSANQVLQGSGGQVIAGTPGTLLSREQDTIILHKGKISVKCGKNALTVQTPEGAVTVKKDSVAVIELSESNNLRLSAISTNEDAATFTPVGSAASLPIPAGHQIVLADGNIEEEELISIDGSESIVGGSIQHVASSSQKTTPPQSEKRFYKQSRAGRMPRLAGSIGKGSVPQNKETRELVSAWEKLQLSSSQPLQLLAQPGTRFAQDGKGSIKLMQGTVFLNSKETFTIETAYGKIRTEANAITMIELTDKCCRVKSFSGPGHQTIDSGNQQISLIPGQELIMSKSELKANEINPADAIARRSRFANQTTDGMVYSVNDFAISSMLHYAGYRNMISSIDSSGKLLEKILKTAVVVEMVTRARGQFKYSALYEENKIAKIN
jgi:hypothetical protein